MVPISWLLEVNHSDKDLRVMTWKADGGVCHLSNEKEPWLVELSEKFYLPVKGSIYFILGIPLDQQLSWNVRRVFCYSLLGSVRAGRQFWLKGFFLLNIFLRAGVVKLSNNF